MCWKVGRMVYFTYEVIYLNEKMTWRPNMVCISRDFVIFLIHQIGQASWINERYGQTRCSIVHASKQGLDRKKGGENHFLSFGQMAGNFRRERRRNEVKGRWSRSLQIVIFLSSKSVGKRERVDFLFFWNIWLFSLLLFFFSTFLLAPRNGLDRIK